MRRTPSSSRSVSDRPARSRASAAGWGLAVSAGLGLGLNLDFGFGFGFGFGRGGVAAAQGPGATKPAPLFTKTPTTPLEFWDAGDYLVRTGQAAQAAPYFKAFIDAKPDDDALLQVRDKYGAASVLRLQDDPATRPLAEPLVGMLATATRRRATDPARVARSVAALTATNEEQDYAVEQLREAGPYAVPAVLKAVDRATPGSEGRALLVRNLGRLDRSAVPPLLAALDAEPDRPGLAADAARALGRLGDTRAVPGLTALAATGPPLSPATEAARVAVARLTGRPYAAQPVSPVRLLTAEARRYHTHAVTFPSDPVLLWVWDPSRLEPAPATVSRSEAEAYLGMRAARAALAIDPADRRAQVALLSQALEKAVERSGFAAYPGADPGGAFAAAVAAGPAVLGDVLRGAIADGKGDLAAVAATALGRVTGDGALAAQGRVNPLVEALSSPGRRARFAAARALVLLDPRRPFAGSSRVVPVLTQFVSGQAAPRALVIDGNANRGNALGGQLRALGYDPVLALTGDEGFRVAADSADVELVVIDIHMIAGDWRLHDTLANLRADARTAGVPIYVVGPLPRQVDLGTLFSRFPGVKFLVTPSGPESLDRQLAIVGRPASPSPQERSAYAREATALLARIAARLNNVYEADLSRAEPALAVALGNPGTAPAASAALADVPLPDAQRGLADAAVDPSRNPALRLGAATQLGRSLQQFGPLVDAGQEARLLTAYDREADPTLRSALGSVVGALRPRSELTGLRLRRLEPIAAPAPPAAPTPAPAAAPADTPPPADAPAPVDTPAPVGGDRP